VNDPAICPFGAATPSMFLPQNLSRIVLVSMLALSVSIAVDTFFTVKPFSEYRAKYSIQP
jgi:hypothetical protein